MVKDDLLSKSKEFMNNTLIEPKNKSSNGFSTMKIAFNSFDKKMLKLEEQTTNQSSINMKSD